MFPPSRVVALFLLALVTFLAGPALADARTEARAHFRKGMAAISAGRFGEGIAELELSRPVSVVADYRVDWGAVSRALRAVASRSRARPPHAAVDDPRVRGDRLPQADLPGVLPEAPDPAPRHGRGP